MRRDNRGDEVLTRAFLDFKQGLHRIVRRIVSNPVDVEDIVHEAYVRSLEASRKHSIEAPKAFIARTARNLALNYITSAGVSLTDNVGTGEALDPRIEEVGIEDRVEVERNLHAYCLAIERLPVQCRRVFTLKQVYGLSQKEIAGRLKISEKTVEYHVSKGLLDCRRYLKRLQVEGVRPATRTGVLQSGTYGEPDHE